MGKGREKTWNKEIRDGKRFTVKVFQVVLLGQNEENSVVSVSATGMDLPLKGGGVAGDMVGK